MNKRHSNKIFIIAALLIILTGLVSCTSANYETSVDYGKEYPVSYFPIIEGGNIFQYNYSNGIIDIKFGSDKSLDKVKEYYKVTFGYSEYHNTIDKLTNRRYINAGSVDKYSYLLEITKAETAHEKQYYNTIVNLRVVLNDVIDLSIDITPTPQVIVTNEPTPQITPEPTATPEVLITPEPTPVYDLSDSDFENSIDLADNMVFIHCKKAESNIDDDNKMVNVQLEIINYGVDETGYIVMDEFCLVDADGNEYHPESANSIFDSGVSFLPKGQAVGQLHFSVPNSAEYFTLLAKHGIGNINIENMSIELFGEPELFFIGDYYEKIMGAIDKKVLPTFTSNQEYTFDESMSIMINDAEYTMTEMDIVDKYSYEITFTNISQNVIIPVELRGFALYDVYHNILIKPTENLTNYDELGFNPVQSGVSEIYNISFEVFDYTDDEYLHLLVYSLDESSSDILFTK